LKCDHQSSHSSARQHVLTIHDFGCFPTTVIDKEAADFLSYEGRKEAFFTFHNPKEFQFGSPIEV